VTNRERSEPFQLKTNLEKDMSRTDQEQTMNKQRQTITPFCSFKFNIFIVAWNKSAVCVSHLCVGKSLSVGYNVGKRDTLVMAESCLFHGIEQFGDIAIKWSKYILTLTRSHSKNIHTKIEKHVGNSFRPCGHWNGYWVFG